MAESINRGAALREIRESKVQAQWLAEAGEPSVLLSLPHECKFGGQRWLDETESLRRFTMDPLNVHPLLRRNGIATRLVSALSYVALATREKYDIYGGSIESPYMIGLFNKLYGAERVSYETNDYSTGCSLTQDAAERILTDGNSVIVTIDLAGLSLHDFEEPLILPPPGR